MKNYQSFTERVALVTNAAHGVGRAAAMQLAFSGGYVVAHYQPQDESGQYVIEQLQAIGTLGRGVAGDLTTETGAQAVIQGVTDVYGRLEMLVQTFAPQLPQQSSSDDAPTELAALSAEAWRDAWRNTVDAAFFGIKATLPWLQARPSPVIVNVIPNYTGAAGAAIRAALVGLTRHLAVELAPRIRVNAVAPDSATVPADEIAKVCSYLLSADARHVTGQILTVTNRS